jgi:hypothetical protein
MPAMEEFPARCMSRMIGVTLEARWSAWRRATATPIAAPLSGQGKPNFTPRRLAHYVLQGDCRLTSLSTLQLLARRNFSRSRDWHLQPHSSNMIRSFKALLHIAWT